MQPNNWSDMSTKKLLQAYVPEGKSANMGMAILEFSDLTDGINILQKRNTFWKWTQQSFLESMKSSRG